MPFRAHNVARSLTLGLGGVLSALVLSASLASAQAARVGPTFLVNQYANGSGTQAKETDVAYDSIHSVYLEVWGFGLVYGRFVTGDGTVLGTGPFTIAGAAGYAACPRVAFSAEANAFMVIWQDNRLNANIPHIFGRLLAFQPSGEPAFQGADFQVSADVTHPRANPAIEYSTGSHVFLAVYQRGDLYGRRFDVTGAALGPEFKLTTDGSWYEQPDVAYNPTADEFFVTFAHWIDVWGAGLIQGRRVRAGTEELLTLVDIDALSRSTYGPTAVAYDGVRNQYLVAWYRVISAFSIYGRLIAANGTPVSSQFTVSSTGTYVANGAAYNPVSDTYFVVFPHHDIAEIYGVQVSGTGVADAMIRVTTVLDSAPTALGVDYPKVATATDRPEWLATANIWWSGAIGQRVRTATVGTPGIFSKMSPSNGAAGQASSVTLSWTPVTDGSFEVCVDAINNNACDTAWQFVGLPTAATIGNLADGTYYWQVRNAAAGNTEANTGTWWSFAVGAASFAKVAPTNGTGGLSSPVALTWSQLAGATSYQVCIDSTGNGSCDSSWVSVGNVTSYPARLSVGTYYWQVRGYMGSYVVADGGTEWVFTVTVGQTAPYTKVTPANGTTGVTNPVSFTWTALAGATTYDICVDQVNDDGCNTSWSSVGTATSYQISGVANGTYYWQVRAWPTRTMADNDAWGSFTVGGTPPPPTGFGKSAPANGATGVSATPTLSWGAVAGATFQLCVDTVNNNACDASWQTLGLATSTTLSTLAAGTYYWQVRAVTGAGTIDADTGAWWSFGVGVGNPPPGGFGKTSPANGASGLGSSVAVSWAPVANASYQVCLSGAGPACDGNSSGWWPTAVSPTRTFDGLTAGTYYWQARATVNGTTTEADGGTWWTFVVGSGSPPPTGFGKSAPANGATGVSATPTLSWGAVAGATFQLCVDTVNNNACDASWQTLGLATSTTLSTLAAGTYYWQVRAATGTGTIDANGGTWWSFGVGSSNPPREGFGKTSPANGASGLGSSVAVSWAPVANASYQVCLSGAGPACDGNSSGWWPTAVSPTRTFDGLTAGTYYWQARATVNGTTTEADGGTWWAFVVGSGSPPPTGFGKSAPANGATGVSATPTLSWGAVAGATFQLCVDAVNNNACDASWQTLGLATSTTLSTLAAGTYYWQVRAATGTGTIDANGGTWWSFGVGGGNPPPGGFGKTSPANGASGLGSSVAVSWAPVANASYQVCLSGAGPACDGNSSGWWPTAVSPTRTFDGLTAGTYYWQARATVNGTTTEADGGTWWAFVVGSGSAANRFGKLAPMTGAALAPGSPVTLSWSAVTGATYEVCVDTVANATCESTWQSAGSATSLVRSDLAGGLHYWQVRAVVNGAPTEANSGAWWTFTTQGPPPPLFSKLTPVSGALGLSSSVVVAWGAVSNASYQVCFDTTDNNSCDTAWYPTAVSPTRTFEGLAPGTYYWQARATVDATTTEADSGAWWSFTVGVPDQGFIDMSPTTAPNGSWVFADGTLGHAHGSTTYYSIVNENADPVHVRGWLVNEDTGQAIFFELPNSIPAFTRRTVSLSNIVGPTAEGRYAAIFQSVPYAADGIPAGRQIYVARSSYWGGTAGILTGPGHEKTGTLVAAGASLPTAWYFSEGARVMSPLDPFETYYTVFNPTQTAANVVVEFVGDRGEGLIRAVTHTVGAQTRWTLSAGDYPDLTYGDFSVRITSSNGVGVVAERPTYWGPAWDGGHAGAGGTTTSRDWYFAEGTSQPAFDTYFTLLNPTTQSITVDATYQLSQLNGVPQPPVLRSYTLPAASRTTIFLWDEVGHQPGVAAEFHASGAIVAERSMYWGTPWSDGSTVPGASAPAVEWHLAEGSTVTGYETFLCLSNPNTSAVTVDVTTYSSAGVAETATVTVGAKSRLTVWMNNTTPANGPVFSSIQNATFAIKAVSTGATPLPIVAEEAVYWNRLAGAGQYWRGGDAMLGWPVIR